jgi:hypothetical protein
MTVLDVSRPPLTCWRVPYSSIELVTQRTEHTKLFYNLNGTVTRVISRDLHYYQGSKWHNQDLTLQKVTSSEREVAKNSVRAYVAQHYQQGLHGKASVVEVLRGDRGIRYHIPKPPIFTGANTFAFMGAFSTLKYEVRSWGIKLSQLQYSRRGPMVYPIKYSKIGKWKFSIDDAGDLVADELRLPKPFIEGADGHRYPCGPWAFNDEYIGLDVDDTYFPESAFPYIIDPTTTLQPSSGLETYISDQATTTNYGTATTMLVGDNKSGGNSKARSLIKFDLSSVPSSDEVTNATLSLFESAAIDQASHGTEAVILQRILKDWVEAEATWAIYSSGNTWATNGMSNIGDDRASATSASLDLDGTAASAFVDWDGNLLDTDVKEMVSEADTDNYGWAITCDEYEDSGNTGAGGGASFFTFDTSEHGTSGNRPKLAVTHSSGVLVSMLQNEGLEANQFLLQPSIMLPG